jgi:hypothetical protein
VITHIESFHVNKTPGLDIANEETLVSMNNLISPGDDSPRVERRKSYICPYA